MKDHLLNNYMVFHDFYNYIIRRSIPLLELLRSLIIIKSLNFIEFSWIFKLTFINVQLRETDNREC